MLIEAFIFYEFSLYNVTKEREFIKIMLDDLKYIHMRDGQDALGIAAKQADQLRHEFTLDPLTFPIEHVVYSGMGGSALAARLSLSWPGYHVPFEISSGYDILATSPKKHCSSRLVTRGILRKP